MLLLVTRFFFLKPVLPERAGPTAADCQQKLETYLTESQGHTEALKQKPSEWMPWYYRATLARLARLAVA
jgi:hypothetical protein